MAQANLQVAENNAKAAAGAGHDARWASDQANNKAKADNNNRYIPPILDMVAQASKQNEVYIFNVGPWKQQRLMGSLGEWIIPACPAGREHSDPVTVPGIVSELYPINEGEYKRMMEDGRNVAMQILGVGPFNAPRNSFVPYGVFISDTNPPKKEDIAEARAKLRQTYLDLKTEADIAYSMGPKAAEETIRPETHFVAARGLGLNEVDCPWMKNAQVPAERKECFNCGTPYKIGIAQCPACKAVLDRAKYDKAVKEGLLAPIG